MTGSRPEQPSGDRQIDRDGEHEEPLGRVEAGPQRHSDDPWMANARQIVECMIDLDKRTRCALEKAIVGLAHAVDRAAREECARIADDIARERLRAGYFDFGASNVRDHIRQTIKP